MVFCHDSAMKHPMKSIPLHANKEACQNLAVGFGEPLRTLPACPICQGAAVLYKKRISSLESTVTRSITRYTKVSEYSVRSRSSAEMRAMISLAWLCFHAPYPAGHPVPHIFSFASAGAFRR